MIIALLFNSPRFFETRSLSLAKQKRQNRLLIVRNLLPFGTMLKSLKFVYPFTADARTLLYNTLYSFRFSPLYFYH